MLRILGIVAAIAILYGLHRYCLYLEQRGYLYYWHKKPMPGGTTPFFLLQEFYQPQIRHVIEAEDHSPEKADDDRYVPDPLHPTGRSSQESRPEIPESPSSN